MQKIEISPELETAIEEMIQSAIEDAASLGDCYGERVEPVEYQCRDGFIPHTNGGFDAMALNTLHNVWGSGIGNNSLVEPFVDSALRDAETWFFEENREAFEKHGYREEMGEPISWLYSKAEEERESPDQIALFQMPKARNLWAEKLREDFYEYESQSMCEGSEFWLQCRVLFFAPDNRRNQSGKPEAYFMAGLNLDFTYGRDSGFEVVWDLNIALEDLTPERLEDIEANMIEAMANPDHFLKESEAA